MNPNLMAAGFTNASQTDLELGRLQRPAALHVLNELLKGHFAALGSETGEFNERANRRAPR